MSWASDRDARAMPLKAGAGRGIRWTASGGDLTAPKRHTGSLSIKSAAHRLAPTAWRPPLTLSLRAHVPALRAVAGERTPPPQLGAIRPVTVAEARIMPTYTEMFETVRNWNCWNGADYGARVAEAEGRHDTATEHRTFRDARTVDPLHVLRVTVELIESLHAGRWDAITEARLRGATWEEVGRAMNERPDAVRCEYAAMIDWVATHQPTFIGLNRYRAAL